MHMNRRANEVPGTVSRTRKQSRVAWLLAALFALLLPSAGVAESTRGITVSTMTHGVKLTMRLPRRTYPRNALVRVTVSLSNVSNHTVRIADGCSLSNGLTADVRNGHGNVVFPRAMDFFPYHCPGSALGQYGIPLRPGTTIARRPLVVLFASWIRPLVILTDGTHGGTEWTGPTVRVTHYHAPPLRVTAQAQSYRTFADIRAPSPVSGPLYYIQSAFCRITGSIQVDSEQNWIATYGTRVEPTCSGVTSWHVVAGWLNHPVATIDYRAS